MTKTSPEGLHQACSKPRKTLPSGHPQKPTTMRINQLLSAAIAVSLFASCGSETASDTEREGASRVDSILGSGSSGQSGDVMLNPAHGEPGHRCEIPVGAPLDSEPGGYVEPNLTMTPTTAPAAQPQVTPTPQPSYDQNMTPAEMLAKGLNPPHGEAGHKCEISVGAPLN
jgi:hypothetical protein